MTEIKIIPTPRYYMTYSFTFFLLAVEHMLPGGRGFVLFTTEVLAFTPMPNRGATE